MNQIIVGDGEVGKALGKVLGLSAFGKCTIGTHFHVLHICFPYSEVFVKEVKRYQKESTPFATIIHSTVPVGTSRKCGAIHSPIRGLHPNLEEGIKTFVKFIGGEQASEVADIFRRAGIKVMLFDDPETTEAMKLFDTEYYRVCLEFMHRVKNYCSKNDLNFSEVYRLANITYNEGYEALGHKEYVRPILEPIMKEIGGHCVMPNKKLIELSE